MPTVPVPEHLQALLKTA